MQGAQQAHPSPPHAHEKQSRTAYKKNPDNNNNNNNNNKHTAQQ